MNNIKEYNYLLSQNRKFLNLNIFFSMAIATFLFRLSVLLYGTVFAYRQIFEIIIGAGFFLHIVGFCFGNFFFSKIKNTRVAYLIVESFFCVLTLFLFLSGAFAQNLTSLFFDQISKHFFLQISIISLFPFLLGIKVNYFLKVSCGKFFDEKKGATSFLSWFMFGSLLGILLFTLFSHFGIQYYYFSAFSLFVIFTMFFIPFQYSPQTIFAKDHSQFATQNENTLSSEDKSNLAFNYLNVSYLMIYIYLGVMVAMKFFGDLSEIRIIFLVIALFAIAFGYLISSIIKQTLWHIYVEMAYPFLFLFYYLFCSTCFESANSDKVLLSFIPCGIILGVALNQSLKLVLSRFDQNKTFSILGFSFFLMPLSFIVALSFFNFSEFWFWVFTYFIFAINLIFPVLYLANKSSSIVRKIIAFVILIVAIPFFILSHNYYKISASDDVFINRLVGKDEMKNLNSKLDYILDASEISVNKKVLMKLSHHSIKNLRRLILVAASFAGTEQKSLFIDGYSSFYQNPSMEIFKNGTCLNYLPKRFSNYLPLPISGKKGIYTERQDLLLFLSAGETKFDLITDIPNLYDFSSYQFRFSDKVYNSIKKRLTNDAIYIVQLPLDDKYSGVRNVIYKHINKYFKYHLFYTNEDYVAIIASDDKSKISFNSTILQRFNSLTENRDIEGDLFCDDVHFAMCMGASTKELQVQKMSENYFELFPLVDDKITADVVNNYSNNNYDLFLKSIDDEKFASTLKEKFRREANSISTLKQSEHYEKCKEFDKEMNELLSLKRDAEYNPKLKKYLLSQLAIRETSYVREAQEFEKQKKWEEAQKVYKAILVINEKNFAANYRMGLVSLTLQKIDDAKKYLNIALSISPQHPQVNYQLGILLLSQGDFKKALSFLLNSVSQNATEASSLFYAGYCYENMENLQDAENYYKKAYVIDSQNDDFKEAISRIAKKIDEQRNRWTMPERSSQREVETDEKFLLPITENARKARLDDDAVKNEK